MLCFGCAPICGCASAGADGKAMPLGISTKARQAGDLICSQSRSPQYCQWHSISAFFLAERDGGPGHAARARSSGGGRRASLACGPPRPLALAALLTRSPRRFFLAGGLLALGFVAVVVAAWRSIAFPQPPCRLPHPHSWQLYAPPAPNNGAPGVDGTAGPAVFLPLLAALSKRE